MDDLALPLKLSFPCRASPGSRAVRHWVVVEEGWVLRTPHDEGLERIAAALGGGVSCLAALASVLPGLRTWWERALRRTGPVIRSADLGSTWTAVDEVAPCCPPAGFLDPADAATHSRSARHAAHVSGVDPRPLAALLRGLGPTADPTAPRSLGVLLGDPIVASDAAVVADAWACGLTPAWVELACASLRDGGIEPRVPLLLAMVQSAADPAWVARTAGAVGDPTLAEWLAWTATDLDRRDPSARAGWLRMGARRADVLALSQAGYSPADAEAVSQDWRISVPGAAQLLARWVAVGYRPSPTALASVRVGGLDFPPQPPARLAVARLARFHPSQAASITDLAVALATWGTVRQAVAVLRRADDPAPGSDVGPRR
ncbi:MAG: hypothetical protein WCF04_05235 [Candidatus Nanopelagicales bacterium]